jgi:hypothetical protein
LRLGRKIAREQREKEIECTSRKRFWNVHRKRLHMCNERRKRLEMCREKEQEPHMCNDRKTNLTLKEIFIVKTERVYRMRTLEKRVFERIKS